MTTEQLQLLLPLAKAAELRHKKWMEKAIAQERFFQANLQLVKAMEYRMIVDQLTKSITSPSDGAQPTEL